MDCCAQKEKGNRGRKWLVGCILAGAILIPIVYTERASLAGFLPFAFVLLCPLMHVFMMFGHKSKEHLPQEQNQEKDSKPCH